jgi:AcrR family transcriptional regulator
MRQKTTAPPALKAESASRDRILQAAIDIVCQGGPAAATAREICSAARITAPTLYYHFEDLYKLYDEVLQLMYVPEALAFPGREQTDPRGMIDYMWDMCIDTARKRPGLVELKNHLVALGRQPQSLNNFYLRLEKAFVRLGQRERLNYPPEEAATIFWSAALGCALKIAAAQRQKTSFASGADESLRVLLLNAIIRSAPARRRKNAARTRLPIQTALTRDGGNISRLTPRA